VLRTAAERRKRLGNSPFPAAIAAATLPLIHRDPFDRLLVAEAMQGKLTILTRDQTIPRYGVPTFW